jgi:fructoselysine-6-P-deglycase FrlB-like protein
MAEMLAVQADLAVPILSGSSTGAVTKAIVRAADAGAPVVVCGCGTSEHAAQGIAALLDGALRAGGVRSGAVEARESFEAALDPRSGGVTIGVSHAGATAATMHALAVAGQAGATTVAITALRDGAVTAEVDHVIATPLEDRSWCHTVGYTSPLLVGAAIAADLRGGRVDASAVEARMVALARLEGPAAELAAALTGVRQLIVVGSGIDAVTARELSLKVEEAVHLPTAMRSLETFLHGHLPACDAETGLVLIAAEVHAAAARAARGATLLRAAARVGVRTAAIVSGEGHEVLGAAPTSAGRIVLPALPAVDGPLGVLVDGALAAQHLTLALAHAAGTNPDLIRREEDSYREAAALARTGTFSAEP